MTENDPTLNEEIQQFLIDASQLANTTKLNLTKPAKELSGRAKLLLRRATMDESPRTFPSPIELAEESLRPDDQIDEVTAKLKSIRKDLKVVTTIRLIVLVGTIALIPLITWGGMDLSYKLGRMNSDLEKMNRSLDEINKSYNEMIQNLDRSAKRLNTTTSDKNQ